MALRFGSCTIAPAPPGGHKLFPHIAAKADGVVKEGGRTYIGFQPFIACGSNVRRFLRLRAEDVGFLN